MAVITGVALQHQAKAYMRSVVIVSLLDGTRLSDALFEQPTTIPGGMDSRAVASAYFPPDSSRPFIPVVDAGGRYLGFVHEQAVRASIAVPVRTFVKPPDADDTAIRRPSETLLLSASVRAVLGHGGLAIVTGAEARQGLPVSWCVHSFGSDSRRPRSSCARAGSRSDRRRGGTANQRL